MLPASARLRAIISLTLVATAVSAAPLDRRDGPDGSTTAAATGLCGVPGGSNLFGGSSSSSSQFPPSSSYAPSSTSSTAYGGTSVDSSTSAFTSGSMSVFPSTYSISSTAPAPSTNLISCTVEPSSTASVPYPSYASGSAIDPFAPIATNAPPSQIPQTGGHPQPTNNIIHQDEPLHTNKFYANMFLGSKMNGIFTTPYVLAWSNGSGQTSSYGMSVTHTEAFQRAFGGTNPSIPGAPASYFINPLGIQSIVMSASGLGNGTQLYARRLDTFSADAILQPAGSRYSNITFPLVQGMAFVSGIYTNLQPRVESGVFFANVSTMGAVAPGVYKWRVTLNDGKRWLLYVSPNLDNGTIPHFTLTSNSLIQGPANFSGLVQVAKNPASHHGEAVYDRAAGIYPTSGRLSGSAVGTAGSYNLSWNIGGKYSGQSLVHYALPHLVDSFDNATRSKVVPGMQLQTTVKGNATAVIGNSWTMVENLPTDLGFAPWSPYASSKLSLNGTANVLSVKAVKAVYSAAKLELQQDMIAQSNLDSMYYSGKALSKFASIVYAVSDLCNEPTLAHQGLQSLKAAFEIFTSNKQIFPLYYDTVWKGIVSSASYNGGDSGADFGNTYYNDHHFHYGYFLHAAAIVAHLDPSWLATNRDWVNALARDVSNPSHADPYFPVFRSFDWYNGHSYAKGLFESGDGKDEESSSEDVMFSYGLKLWGRVSGDASMEARGNLMLAVQARSLPAYFLMESTNRNQPPQFIGNKVTGIMFENKIDHTTYFGANFEYVQGIHMIPLTPASALTRRPNFVREEWQTYFARGAVADANNVTGGWKGILYANLALIDPVAAYKFFASNEFSNAWLDGGASRTWYLAFAAGLGGA